MILRGCVRFLVVSKNAEDGFCSVVHFCWQGNARSQLHDHLVEMGMCFCISANLNYLLVILDNQPIFAERL